MTLLRFTILTAMLAGAVSLKAMEHTTKKDFSVCQQLKTIAPDAPQQTYDTLAAKLKEHNLTTCDCIKHILAARKQRAFRAVQQEIGFYDEEWQQYFPAFLKAVQKHTQSSKQDVTCESTISPTLCQDVKTMLRNHNLHESIIIQENEEVSNASITTQWGTFIQKDLSFKMSGNKGSILYINPHYFQKYSHQAKQGIIAHEIMHRALRHHEEELFLRALAAKYNIAELETINKFFRLREAEADRLPAACNSPCVARHIEAKSKENIEFFGILPKFEHPTHPTTEKRLVWATRIRRMREIEEQQHHKKLEAEQQQRINVLDHQIALHSPF